MQGLLESQRTDVVRMNNNAILYNSLKIEVENMRNLLNSLVAKQNETLVSARLGGLRTSNIKIIDRALVPGGPFSPNTRRNLMMALLLGIFGGLGLIFFIEYLDNTVKGPEDVEKLTGLPSLGIIPHLSPDGLKKRYEQYSAYSYSYGAEDVLPDATMPEVSEIELINHLFPKFSISEDYRTVRTSILFSHADTAPKTICFTSTLPQEGKTATVANMAISFAQLEGRVLVIDADLRKPRMHKIFKAKNSVGLSGFLTGKVAIDDCIQKTAVENIWIIPAGPHPPNPAELLNSSRMKDLIALVKDRFDVILIDTPPVLAVTDAAALARSLDGVILVAQPGKTRLSAFRQTLEQLAQVNARVLGVVLNNVVTRGKSYGYHYKEYRHYTAYQTYYGSSVKGKK